jgi:hypothetical protein
MTRFCSRSGQVSKIDELAERLPGPSVLGAELEKKPESWVDNSFRRTHPRLSDRVIGKLIRLPQKTRMATTHYCPSLLPDRCQSVARS